MPIIEPAIRPPSEANSFLLQVTLGCSSDTCTFCGAYKQKPFRIKDPSEVFKDIDRQASWAKDIRRVFLMDGDALVLANSKLVPVLQKLAQTFPRLTRVSSYATGSNISRKSDAELEELAAHKLNLIYMGLESGSQEVLDLCGKTSRVTEMIEAVHRAEQAHIKSSVIVLLGLGGRKYSQPHVQGTIDALNRMQPRYLSFLSVMVIPGTTLAQEVRQGNFMELDPRELLQEAYGIIQGLDLRGTVFRSDHASNHLALEGTLPKDKEVLLESLRAAMDGDVGLRPEFLRGL